MSSNGFSKEAAAKFIEWVKQNYSPLDSLDSKEAGELIKIPAKTVTYYARTGQIPFFQMGRHLRFSPIILAYWIIEKHQQPYLRPGERSNGDEAD